MKTVVAVNVKPGSEAQTLGDVKKLWGTAPLENKAVYRVAQKCDLYLTGDADGPPLGMVHEIRKLSGVTGTEVMVVTEEFAETGKAENVEVALLFVDAEPGQEATVLDAVRKMAEADDKVTAVSGGFAYQMMRDVYVIVVAPNIEEVVGKIRSTVKGIRDTEWYHLSSATDV